MYDQRKKANIPHFKYLTEHASPVASSGVKSVNQFCMMECKASYPISVAHVTSHRTISRRLQFTIRSVIRMTCAHKKCKHFNLKLCIVMHLSAVKP